MSDTTTISESDREHLYLLFFGELGMCGCGNPEEAYGLVRDVLALAPLYDAGGGRRVVEMCGGPGAAHLVLSMLDEVDLMSHGGSIYAAWLTPKGERALALLRAIQYDEMEGVGFPHDGGECTPDCWPGAGA